MSKDHDFDENLVCRNCRLPEEVLLQPRGLDGCYATPPKANEENEN